VVCLQQEVGVMKGKALSIRLNEDMYNHLKTVAKTEGRTLNAQVEQFLLKGFARHKKEIAAIESLDSEEDGAQQNTEVLINQQEETG